MNAALMTSSTAEWYSPPGIIERVIAVLGAIDLDPCSNTGVPNVPAAMHYTAADDGLARDWHGRVFVNPPYGRAIAAWVTKLCDEHAAGRVTEAIALLPARVDTQWWRALGAYPVCFVRGRLTFAGATASAPFPSALVYLGEHVERFVAGFADVGDVYARVATPSDTAIENKSIAWRKALCYHFKVRYVRDSMHKEKTT